MLKSATGEDENKLPAVFFDRDGTLIDEIGYLGDPGGVFFYPGIPEALKKLKDRGYVLVVITNQSGIGRGFFDEETALAANLAMIRKMEEDGVGIDAVYYCPHHTETGYPGERPELKFVCACRKPAAGMIHSAVEALNLDLTRAAMFGDTDKDQGAARNAGIPFFGVETGPVPPPAAERPNFADVEAAVDHWLGTISDLL